MWMYLSLCIYNNINTAWWYSLVHVHVDKDKGVMPAYIVIVNIPAF